MPSDTLKDAAVGFLALVARGNVDEAWDRHVGPGLVHHHAYFPGDAASLKQAMLDDAAANPGKSLTVHRVLRDGDEVAVYSHVRQRADDPGWAVAHIFRFEYGRIVEMWDVGQEVPRESPNEHGAF